MGRTHSRPIMASELPIGASIMTLYQGRPRSLFSQIIVMASGFIVLGSPLWLTALLYYFYNYTSWDTKKKSIIGWLMVYLIWPQRMNVRT